MMNDVQEPGKARLGQQIAAAARGIRGMKSAAFTRPY